MKEEKSLWSEGCGDGRKDHVETVYRCRKCGFTLTYFRKKCPKCLGGMEETVRIVTE
jgi:rubrerythrin